MHSQISKNSQITLSKSLMKELDLKPGDELEFEVEPGKITFHKTDHPRKLPQKFDVWDLYGLFWGVAVIIALCIMYINGMF